MSQTSALPNTFKLLVKSNHPLLKPNLRFHKTHSNHINSILNPHLGQKIRFHNVAKETSGSPVLSGKNCGLTTAESARAKRENLKWEKLSQNLETGAASPEGGQRTSSQDQTQPSQPPVPEAISSNTEQKRSINALAGSFEAQKRKPAARNYSSIAPGNMSGQLTKVLTKDACPRK